MPWRTTCVEDERTEFLAAWLKQATPVAVLCRAFGISRQSGYERIARFQRESWAAVEERSHARHHQAHAMDPAVAAQVVALREAHPYWGPVKLRARLQALEPTTRWPAASTIGALLHQRGLTWARRRRARAAPATQPLAAAVLPNDVWSADSRGGSARATGPAACPLRSRTMPAGFCCAARWCRRRTSPWCSPAWPRRFASMACRGRCGPTTGRRLRQRRPAGCRG